jgi:hypothetical protein
MEGGDTAMTKTTKREGFPRLMESGECIVTPAELSRDFGPPAWHRPKLSPKASSGFALPETKKFPWSALLLPVKCSLKWARSGHFKIDLVIFK